MSEPIVKRRPMIDLEEFERRLRKPHTTNQRDDDPLAELARSFAGEEVDPYKTVFEPLSRRPSGAWRNEQDRGDSKMQAARSPSSVAISPQSKRACLAVPGTTARRA